MSQTTIRVNTETRDLLEQMKVIPQEPFDAVIKRMIKEFTEGNDDEGILKPSVNKLVKRRLQGSDWLDVKDARAMATGSGKGGRKLIRTSAKKPGKRS